SRLAIREQTMKPIATRLAVSLFVILCSIVSPLDAGQILSVRPIEVVDGVHPNPNVFLFESEVQKVWAQADIDVHFLPPITANLPAYYNVNNQPTAYKLFGIGGHDPKVEGIVQQGVINVFFVNSLYIAPAASASGLAIIGGNRII